jgi:hypothetical protein
VPNVSSVILVMCAAAGIAMVLGSILLLYRGVIELGGKVAGNALEAQFKDQMKINIRNPALVLFTIGFLFFVLAVYFATREEDARRSEEYTNREASIAKREQEISKREEEIGREKLSPIIISGHITGADISFVKLQSEETQFKVSTDGEVFMTVQPIEKLILVIDAQGYKPSQWVHRFRPDEAHNGQVHINPEFVPEEATRLRRPISDTGLQQKP